MQKSAKEALVRQVIVGARENSIGVVLFHQAVARILGINVTDIKCLDIIALKGSASPSQLAELTGLSTGSTTAMIDRLEKKALVERRANPDDRRGTIVTLTRDAGQKLPRLFGSLAEAMEALVSSYSERELKILSDFFGKIGSLWREEREQLHTKHGRKTGAHRRVT
jgi:DNA-binding MarR family transcriptional regulator